MKKAGSPFPNASQPKMTKTSFPKNENKQSV